MAEYSREQRNQPSRAIANNATGSRQLKGFVDNRTMKKNNTSSLIQRFLIYRAGIMKPSQADVAPNAPLEKMGLSTFSRFKSLPARLRQPGARINRIDTNNIPNGLMTLRADNNHVSIVPNADVASAKNLANWTLTQDWINGQRDAEYTNPLTANSIPLIVNNQGLLP